MSQANEVHFIQAPGLYFSLTYAQTQDIQIRIKTAPSSYRFRLNIILCEYDIRVNCTPFSTNLLATYAWLYVDVGYCHFIWCSSTDNVAKLSPVYDAQIWMNVHNIKFVIWMKFCLNLYLIEYMFIFNSFNFFFYFPLFMFNW